MLPALYNDTDPFVAQWLRRLSGAGAIARGLVSEVSIADLDPVDVESHDQCHFFAGIGGWSHALRLAGWPDTRPVWTGSCPCQPFSLAGDRSGFDDSRHLWPAFFRLIRECRPPVVFGEQVASPDGIKWLDTVRADLEAAGYAFGSSDLCAAGLGAPHIRQRVFFVGHADHARLAKRQRQEVGSRIVQGQGPTSGTPGTEDRALHGLGHPERRGWNGVYVGDEQGYLAPDARRTSTRIICEAPPRATTGIWHPAEWVYCADDRYRPIEPGTWPLAHGASARVGRLRAYGNAIVPQVAATFIRAYMESVV